MRELCLDEKLNLPPPSPSFSSQIAYTTALICVIFVAMLVQLKILPLLYAANAWWPEKEKVLTAIAALCLSLSSIFRSTTTERKNFEIVIISVTYRERERASNDNDGNSSDSNSESDENSSGNPNSKSSSESNRKFELDVIKVPRRFILGTLSDGGMKEASRRWRITADWRRRDDIDEILFKPIPE